MSQNYGSITDQAIENINELDFLVNHHNHHSDRISLQSENSPRSVDYMHGIKAINSLKSNNPSSSLLKGGFTKLETLRKDRLSSASC